MTGWDIAAVLAPLCGALSVFIVLGWREARRPARSTTVIAWRDRRDGGL